MSTCQLVQQVTFDVSPEFTDREVACRVAMLVGVSGPLAWCDEDDGMPTIVSLTDLGPVWYLGNDYTLGKRGPQSFCLMHAKAKIGKLAEYLEWIFKERQ